MSAILFLPAPPAPPTQQFDDRTRKLDRVKTNATTVMPVQQQNIDPEATTRFSLPADGIVNSLDNAVDSAASQSPIAQSTNPAILQTANPRKSVAHRSSSQAWWRCCLHVAPAVGMVVLSGPGSYWTMPQPDGMTCDASAACPITNVKWSDYESLLKISDIEYEVSEEYSDSVEEGNIISTDPANVAIAAASVVARKSRSWSPRESGRRRFPPIFSTRPAHPARIQSTH